MAGSHTGVERFLRSTNITGNVYQATTAGAAADNTTINSYAAAGLFATIQFVPTTTQSTSATVPAAPSTAANKGWREVAAQDADDQLTWDAATWTVRLRMLASASQSCLTTVIVYRQNGAGTTEVGRGTDTRTLTTTVATVDVSVAANAALVFAAGDKLQVEVYTTTLLLGVPTPPTLATTITCRIGESDANSGSKIVPGTYALQVVSSATTALSLAGAVQKAVATTKTASISLTATATKAITIDAPKVAALSLATAIQKTALIPRSAAIAFETAIQRTVLIPRTVALSLVGAVSRSIVAQRSFTTALSLDTVFARAVTSARSFTTALTLTASGLVQMAFDVLNRITGAAAALTTAQAARLKELWQIRGLDTTKPLVVSASTRKVPSDGSTLSQTVTEAPAGTITVQRVVAGNTDDSDGSLSAEQAKHLRELWRQAGLDADRPLVVTSSSRDAGSGISQTISESAGTVTVTRNE